MDNFRVSRGKPELNIDVLMKAAQTPKLFTVGKEDSNAWFSVIEM